MIQRLYERLFPFCDTVTTADGKTIDLFRCETDRELVFNTQASLRRHSGHKLRQPVRVNPIENLYLKLMKEPN